MDANSRMIWNVTRVLPWHRRMRRRFALVLYSVGLRQIAVRVAGGGLPALNRRTLIRSG
jgi:hypothetical protein